MPRSPSTAKRCALRGDVDEDAVALGGVGHAEPLERDRGRGLDVGSRARRSRGRGSPRGSGTRPRGSRRRRARRRARRGTRRVSSLAPTSCSRRRRRRTSRRRRRSRRRHRRPSRRHRRRPRSHRPSRRLRAAAPSRRRASPAGRRCGRRSIWREPCDASQRNSSRNRTMTRRERRDGRPPSSAAAALYSPRVAAMIPSTPASSAARPVAGAEVRDDLLVQDAAGDRVGERTLEAVARLDAHLAVAHEDEEDDAVVELLASGLPRLGGPAREVLERGRGQLGEDRDDDLVRGLLLERLRASPRAGRRRDGGTSARVVVEVARSAGAAAAPRRPPRRAAPRRGGRRRRARSGSRARSAPSGLALGRRGRAAEVEVDATAPCPSPASPGSTPSPSCRGGSRRRRPGSAAAPCCRPAPSRCSACARRDTRFSVPSSCACRSRKFALAFSSG